MAEYLLSYAVEKLADQLIEEAVSLSRVRGQVQWVESELRRSQCFLEDAEAKRKADKRVANWVADIRDVAYDAEDAIDTFILETNRTKQGFMAFIERNSFISNLMALQKVNQQIEGIKKTIQHISSSRSTYGIENLGNTQKGDQISVGRLREKRRSSPHVGEDIIGLQEDIECLAAQLTLGVPRRSVVSIVGMGGLGKTTLANKVYNNSGVVSHFDSCAWVYVSQEYRAMEILQDLVKKLIGLEKVEIHKLHKEELKEKLSGFLEHLRYLIVMDDIWSDEVWDDLQEAFPDKENHSRIMLTTRFKDVATHANPSVFTHELRFLNEQESWELFSRKVGMTNPSPGLEEMGRQMLRKCGGLPLAIVTLGGLLSMKEATFSEWLKVLQSLNWQLREHPSGCSEILGLSYYDLPSYLKPCFLYLGLFPEDFEICARRLILLWVAEGFVHQRGYEPLEDVAEDYLEELISRNMIEVARKKINGRIKRCRVHDLLRDLAIQKASQDRFLDIQGVNRFAFNKSGARRLALQFDVPPATYTSNLRSFLCFDPSGHIFIEFTRLKLLRILDLEGVHMPSLDKCIGDLYHLKYLGLRGTWLRKLPSSVCNLCNLQTLDVRSTLLSPVPHVICKMGNLRHLYLNEFHELTALTLADESLGNLQTLQGVRIGQDNSIENGLDKLTSLRELRVGGNLVRHEKALVNWITKLDGLECLKLRYTAHVGRMRADAIPKLMAFSNHKHLYKLHLTGQLQKLAEPSEFPPNLTELSLRLTILMQDPMTTLEKLPNLRVLALKESAYVGKKVVCSSGGFPQLQYLKLSFLNILGEWRIEQGAMPKLRHLEIIECKHLRLNPQTLQPLTALCELKLGCLPREFEAKVQEHKDKKWYQVQHILPI